MKLGQSVMYRATNDEAATSLRETFGTDWVPAVITGVRNTDQGVRVWLSVFFPWPEFPVRGKTLVARGTEPGQWRYDD